MPSGPIVIYPLDSLAEASTGPVVDVYLDADIDVPTNLVARAASRASSQAVAGTRLLGTTASIDMTNENGKGFFLAIPSGYSVSVYLVVVRCISATSITDPPTVSVRGSLTRGDVVSDRKLYGLTSAGKRCILSTRGGSAAIMVGPASLMIDVVTPATATVMIATVDAFGYVTNG